MLHYRAALLHINFKQFKYSIQLLQLNLKLNFTKNGIYLENEMIVKVFFMNTYW